jgi:hypothetical protein
MIDDFDFDLTDDESSDEEKRETRALGDALIAELEASGLERCSEGPGPWYVHMPDSRCRMCGRWIDR